MQSRKRARSRIIVESNPLSKIELHPTSREAFKAGSHPGVHLGGAVPDLDPIHPFKGTRRVAGHNPGGPESGAAALHHLISGESLSGKIKFFRTNRVCFEFQFALHCDNRSCTDNQSISRAFAGGQGKSTSIGQRKSSRVLPAHRQHLQCHHQRKPNFQLTSSLE